MSIFLSNVEISTRVETQPTRLQDNEITIAVSEECNFDGNQGRVIGSPATISFKTEKKGTKKNPTSNNKSHDLNVSNATMEQDRRTKKSEGAGKINSILTKAVTWLVGRIRVILNMAS